MTPGKMRKKNEGGIDLGSGSSRISGSKITGRDHIEGLSGKDVNQIIETLLKYFPRGYLQNPNELDKTLGDFRRFHEQLHEWKDLHNALDEIITSFAQFSSEIHRYNSINKIPHLSTLRNLWYPVSVKVDLLLEFAKNIALIGKRYNENNGNLEGERWAVKISDMRSQINLQLGFDETSSFSAQSPNLGNKFNYFWGRKPDWWITLYELNNEFNHIAYGQMHFADKKLRETANELYTLSKSISGIE